MVYQKVWAKEVLNLYNQKKKNISEIAKILNCSTVTIWMHLKRARIDIEQRFCLGCRKKYKVSHKYNKGKRCPECQIKRAEQLRKKYQEEHSDRLIKLRKKWRQKNPKRKLNWLNLHKDPKHIQIRDKIEMLVNKNVPEEEITKKLNLKVGKDSRDRFSLRWYKKCIKAKESGRRVHELYPEIRKKLPFLVSTTDRRKGAINLIKKLKKEKRYKQHQSKAAKLGGLKGGPASIKKQRENKPYYFMNVPFDSEQENFFCKLLVKHNIIKKPIEGKNAHIRIGRKDFDFLIKQKLFVEYHPFDFNRSTEEYFRERRKILDKNGFKNHPLIVIGNLNEFYEKILPLSKK